MKQRHVIECTVGHLQQFRRIARRVDQLAVTYRASVLLAMLCLVLRRHCSVEA